MFKYTFDTLISKENIKEKVKELARRIDNDFEGEDILLIGLLRGSVIFLSDLARELKTESTIDFMVVSSYGNKTESSRDVKILKDLEEDIQGRNIIIVTYGGYSRHGGGAFSGKDPTKVDRSAAYAARYVAKNIVAAGLADKCEIQLSYAIGVAKPVSITVDTFGTGKVSEEKLVELVNKNFDLRPGAIIRDLDLRKPIYKQVAAYGHFGRNDLDLPWERTDKAEILRKEALGE